MIQLLSVAAGGGLGAAARFLLTRYADMTINTIFPVGTLLVNILGSLVLGFLVTFFEFRLVSVPLRGFLTIGFLGGFTTFSSYAIETVKLFQEGEIRMALLNLLLNSIIGLVAVIAGILLAKLSLEKGG